MVLKNNNIVIPINIQESNHPIIYSYYLASAQKKLHGPLFRSGMSFIGLYYFYLFGNIRTDIDISETEGEVMLTEDFENFSHFCGPCVRSS